MNIEEERGHGFHKNGNCKAWECERSTVTWSTRFYENERVEKMNIEEERGHGFHKVGIAKAWEFERPTVTRHMGIWVK